MKGLLYSQWTLACVYVKITGVATLLSAGHHVWFLLCLHRVWLYHLSIPSFILQYYPAFAIILS